MEQQQDTALLELKEIGKAYGKKEPVWVLKDFNFTLHSGEYLAVVGDSGAGKSTLMNLMGLLDVPSTGNCYCMGHLVSKCTEKQIASLRRKNIGFVFQSFCLLEGLTALENVMLPMRYAGVSKRKARKRAILLLAQMGLSDRLSYLPYALSGGQQQRVAIARALANDPDIILADEPTGNLDPDSSKEIISLLKKQARLGKGVVVITHDLRVAADADRVLQIFPLPPT